MGSSFGGYQSPVPHRHQDRGHGDRRVNRATLHVGLEVLPEQIGLETALTRFESRMPDGSYDPLDPSDLHVTLAGSAAALRGFDERHEVREGQIEAMQVDLRTAAQQLGYTGCRVYVDPSEQMVVLGAHRDAVAVSLLEPRHPDHTIDALRGLLQGFVGYATVARGQQIPPLHFPALHMTIGRITPANFPSSEDREAFVANPLNYVNRCHEQGNHPVAAGIERADRVILPGAIALGDITVSEVRL